MCTDANERLIPNQVREGVYMRAWEDAPYVEVKRVEKLEATPILTDEFWERLYGKKDYKKLRRGMYKKYGRKMR